MAAKKSRKHASVLFFDLFKDSANSGGVIKFKVCEMGTICQRKVYERGTFSVKNGSVRAWTRGGASKYKPFLRTPCPRATPLEKVGLILRSL